MTGDDLDQEEVESPVRSGRVLGRYVLCYELASGGMATVYLARTESAGFERLVALKMIHPHLAKQREFVEMFLDEAKIAARIVHPNVCSVFDFGQEQGTYYLAMDYLVGETSGRFMRAVWKRPDMLARKETLPVFARLIAEAAEGLHAAHEARGADGQLLGIVHRDVTPQNLFVGYDGSMRVVDFGVALSAGRSHHTAAGTLKGKYPYMSPEQVSQKPVDRRTDVWALGVCLWEMLAGRRLFRLGSDFETLRAVTEAPLPKPSEANPAVPPALDAIVMKALERDRELRYATARQMSKELSAAASALGGATASDVAEMMEELFAAERAERASLMERARSLDPEQPSTSKVVPAPVSGGFGAREPDSGSGAMNGAPTFRPSPRRVPTPTTPKASWRPYAIVGALLFVALLGLAAFAAIGGHDPRAEGLAVPPTTSGDGSTASALPPPLADAGPEDVGVDAGAAAPNAGITDAGAVTGRVAHAGGGGEHRHPRDAGRRTPVAPAAGGTGRLSVVTPPGWADIFVEGRRVGRSPAEISLPAGRHAVRIIPYGDGAPIERTVTVDADGSARLVVRLDPP